MTGPRGGSTLPQLLERAARETPDQVLTHVRGDGTERTVTLRELHTDALRVAGGLAGEGVAPGTFLPLVADAGDSFQSLFWGALLAGAVPVPLAPDPRRIRAVWELLDQPPLLVDGVSLPLLEDLPAARALDLSLLRRGAPPPDRHRSASSDVALLQFSSGSTGDPKGVELTHAAILANLGQIRTAAALTPDDVVVSWMPYFHDMGLIGTHLAPLAAGVRQVRISPSAFAKRPQLWLETAARHRATLLSAANFALALAVRRVPDESLAGLDLSRVRLVLVGAEPISPAVWRDFTAKVRPAGLDPRALQPVYGLAEATLAVAFPPPGELAVPVVVDRAALGRGRVVDTEPGAHATELMDVGLAVPGCAVRVVDEAGRPLPDRRVGHIEVSGPQVARGYHRRPEASAATFTHGWLRTGDLGFLRNGRLCVSGRHKDVLFVNGRNFHASDLEAVAAGTPGLPSGTAAVVGSTDPATGSERVVVFVQWARPPKATAERVLDRVAARVREALGHDDVRVQPLPPGGFPRTTSGKLRRSLLRARFEAGAYPRARTATSGTAAAAGRTAAAAPVTAPPAPVTGLPRSRRDVERAVTRIWARVLDRPESAIGPHDRFFALGGSSLKAMQVLAELEDLHGTVLRPSILRDGDTVAALTDLLLHHTPPATAPDASTGPDVPTTADDPATLDDPAGSRALSAAAPADPAVPARRPGTVITGLACRFPGAATPEEFWQQLAAGADLVTDVPPDRWEQDGGRSGRRGGFLDEPAAFDADFFGVAEAEARALDPQARIFLELAHEALERAGYAGPRRHGHRIGVFAAVGDSGYREVLDRAAPEPGRLPPGTLTGNLPNLVAARVAQFLDLDGPAVAVDTACSSALVALHQARRSIEDGECDLAVVGGVNLNLTATGYRLLEEAQALSPTGRCRTFSSTADGFVPGEGGAALVLSRLDLARRHGDPVLAVLRGTAVNNDGRSLSLLAPNPLRQREVITRAHRAAGVEPGEVSYVEAHGTGTPIGDPVELASLAHAFPGRTADAPLLVGSVKTNVGHLLNAAGMPGLVKVVLALVHRRLPPSLHHTPPLPALAGHGFAPVTALRDWHAPGPLLAGVNAFGFGGTNAHAVLEQAPPQPPGETPEPAAGPHLFTLSARSAPALRTAAGALADHLAAHPVADEGELCATVGTARDDGPFRLALVADGDLAVRLAGPTLTEAARTRPRLVFLLPGQGTLRPGQGRDLHRRSARFRDTLYEASDHLGPLHGRSLAAWCLDPDVTAADLARTELAQPLLVAFGAALARQLGAWGVQADAVAGYSVGEITAGCVSGALTLADAVTFAAERGRLMATLAPGAMAAVAGGPDTVRTLLDAYAGELEVAAFNGPARTVIAGPADTVARAVEKLAGDGVAARHLSVSHAFHSHLVQPVLDRLSTAAARLTPRPPVLPHLSTTTARWQPDLDPAHLRQHARQPVRFTQAVGRLLDDGYDTFLELGTGGTLLGPVRDTAATRTPAPTVRVSAALRTSADDGHRDLLETVGRLWTRGTPVRRPAPSTGRPRTTLPTYPFQRRTYWPAPPVPVTLHRMTWRPAPVATGGLPRSVLLTGPGAHSTEAVALADRLRERGSTVSSGETTADAAAPDAVVLLAGPSGEHLTPDTLDTAQHAALTAFHATRTTVARLRPARLLVVTEDVHSTGSAAERPRPAQALYSGLVLALAEEDGGCAPGTLDLCSGDSAQDRLAALERTLRSPAAPPQVLAARSGALLHREPVPVPPDEPGRSGAGTPLPPDGVYLVTGGTGGVGAALARDLADRGRPTLVLTGRSPQPPAGLLDELTALGATAAYRRADVCREADVDALLSELPHLDAVFHAAGVLRPGSLRGKDIPEMRRVLAPKVQGTLVLSRALRRHDLTTAVCVALSSITSVLPGSAGALGDYAAANAFLDAFAAAERAAGRPWQSLSLARVDGTGMGAAPSGARSEQVPALPLTAALTALRTAHRVDAAHLLVADLSTPSPSGPRTPSAPRTPPGTANRLTPSAALPAPAAGDLPEGADAAQLADVLRALLSGALDRAPDTVSDDEPFLALGLDSLAAVDLVKHLEQRLGRSLPTTLFFEFQTVRELAAHLARDGGAGAAGGHRPDTAPAVAVAADPLVTAGPFPLTAVQLALHTSGRLHPGLTAYGHVRLTVDGPLRADLLEQALTLLVARHPALRLRFEADGGAVRQRVAAPTPAADWFEVHDGTASQETLRETEQALCNRPFDLGAEPPFRAALLRETADRAHLLLLLHHAAGDGYSLNVLGEELWTAYTALARGNDPQLPPLTTDFVVCGQDAEAARDSAAFQEDLRYWRTALAARGEPLRLPWDGDPEAPPVPPLASHQAEIPAPLTAALHHHAARHGVSLFHLLLAAYTRCLSRWSGRPDVTVSVARARREARRAGIGQVVAPLADTLPVTARVDLDEPAHRLAEQLRLSWNERERHALPTSLDLARLLTPAAGGAPRTASPAAFSFARFPASRDADCPVTVRPTAAATATAATRLGLLCWEEDPTRLRFSWNHPAALFHPTTVSRLTTDFVRELAELTGTPVDSETAGRAGAGAGTRWAPDGPSAEQPSAGQPSAGQPSALDVVARLGAAFRATPDAVAVETGDGTLSYAELDRVSAALAERLRGHGVARGDLVGLLTEQGADTVTGVVGILRAGAGWVPLDPTHPSARWADHLARTGARVLVCHAPTSAAARALTAPDATGARPVAVDLTGLRRAAADPSGQAARQSSRLPPREDPGHESRPGGPAADPGTTAYVIFTSGSTGRPKAVPITHRALGNYLDWALRTFGYQANDRLAQTASPCFDASVRQLLAPLLVGATVVTVPRHLVRDPALLLDHVEQRRITVWSSVPTLWERLLAAAEQRVHRGAAVPDLSALRWVHVGGEALPAAQVRRWFDLFGTGQRVSNLYGPTEATINATCHIVAERPADHVRHIPIGRPLTGTEVAVVDSKGRDSAPGEPGELLIAGVGLTPGYLGEPELTAAAFTERDGRRWYRSGDRVRRLDDGELEFLGRLDDQVKIRGHRVEPGEIEAVLLTHPGVARAAVVHRDARLEAHVEPAPGATTPDAVALRAHLSQHLPAYMLPARFHHVAAMPLTDTGKIARSRLTPPAVPAQPGGPAPGTPATPAVPASALPVTVRPGTPPKTATEQALARIWCALLDLPAVHREDNFFALGGDSLLVLEVFARLEREVPVLPRPTVIYTHGTLAALAAAVDRTVGSEQANTSQAAAGPAPGPFPLTPAQRGFLLAENLEAGSGSTWLAPLRLHGTLHREHFQTAVDVLVARHPMLRTVFPAGARPPVQQELPPTLRLPVEFGGRTSATDLPQRIAAERRRRLEPWAWPLLRLTLLTLAPEEHVLLVHGHHLIGDGFSAALLGRELLSVHDSLTRGETADLPPLRGTFREHAVRVAATTDADTASSSADRPAHLDMPYDPPPLRARDVSEGGRAHAVAAASGQAAAQDRTAPSFRATELVLDAAHTERLRLLAANAGTTLFAPLLTAYYRALAALTGRRDLLLGLAVSGRDHGTPDASRVFGPFAAAVPVRPGVEPDGGSGTTTAARDFDADLRRIAAEAATARTLHPAMPRLPNGLPAGGRFFFTFLEFAGQVPTGGGTLRLAWDGSGSELTGPPVGTDVLLAARPTGAGLRLTLRASAAALDAERLAALRESLRHELLRAPQDDPGSGAPGSGDPGPAGPRPDAPAAAARPAPDRSSPAPAGPGARLDAALVGYLPSPRHLAALAGLPVDALPREALRAALFPDARARLLEHTLTPLGRSGFVALPLFADELTSTGRALADSTAQGVHTAAALGARCVSLAGMIPALTGYGFDVLRRAGTTVPLTTGHAATAVSVVKAVQAALDATGRDLADATVAVVGCGSIGSTAAALLLRRSPRPPAGLLLCDVPGSGARLERLAGELRALGAPRTTRTRETGPALPDAVYEADLVLTAVSGAGTLLDVDRLRPGTVVVDDSFPHCLDTARALHRMRQRRDVLVVGGGLLSVGETRSHVVDGLPADAAAGHAARGGIPGTMASCRLESLLHAARPGLPLVHGLVDAQAASAYWDAVETAGVHAGPPHLLHHVLDTSALTAFPAPGPLVAGTGPAPRRPGTADGTSPPSGARTGPTRDGRGSTGVGEGWTT